MFNRRDLLLGTAAATIVPSLLSGELAQAQGVDLLKVFVPAAPGGGWDQTARAMRDALLKSGLVNTVEVRNSPGAGLRELLILHPVTHSETSTACL